MGYKKIDKIIQSFKQIDKIVSPVFLYYTSICGFILAWITVSVMLLTIAGEIPQIYVIILRVFYFLLSFLCSLKITLIIAQLVKKYNS